MHGGYRCATQQVRFRLRRSIASVPVAAAICSSQTASTGGPLAFGSLPCRNVRSSQLFGARPTNTALRMASSEATLSTPPKEKPVCVPCESLDPSHLLSVEEIEEALVSKLPLWTAKGEERGGKSVSVLSRCYTAKDFQAALDSINAVGVIAERENHHPDFHLTSYREVEIRVWTHSVGGVTINDVGLAKMMDEEVKVSYSPKWLKEHPEAESTAK